MGPWDRNVSSEDAPHAYDIQSMIDAFVDAPCERTLLDIERDVHGNLLVAATFCGPRNMVPASDVFDEVMIQRLDLESDLGSASLSSLMWLVGFCESTEGR